MYHYVPVSPQSFDPLMDAIASDGMERRIRDERAEQWFARVHSAGFMPAQLPSEAWESLRTFCSAHRNVGVAAVGAGVRLLWHDMPFMFGTAWTCGT